MAALFLVGSRPFPVILSPLMRLSGRKRSQETKWFSVCHLLISYPVSLMTVIAVITSMLSIWVRSVPVRQNNLSRKSNCGTYLFVFLSRPLRCSTGSVASWLRSFFCWRVHAGGLHRDSLNAALLQPSGHGLQLGRGASEASYRLFVAARRYCHIVGFVADINARGIGVEHFQVQ